MTEVTRADRRLQLRLVLGLLAVFVAGVPILLLALAARTGWGPLRRLDTSVTDDLNGYALGHPGWVRFFEDYSDVIGPPALPVAVTVTAVVLLLRRRYRLGGWVLASEWGAVLLGALLKYTVRRSRPDLADAVSSAPGYSFPSGHALGGTVGCGLLALVLGSLLPALWRRVAWLVAGLLIVTVCFARVFLGVHYLTDVSAGFLLGLGWLTVTTSAFHAWRRDVGLPPTPADEIEPELAGGEPELGRQRAG